MRRLSPLLTIVPALVFALSCEGGDPTGPVDETPPTVTAVTAIDESHFAVAFSEELNRESAEDPGHYVLAKADSLSESLVGFDAMAPGDTLSVMAISLQSDKKAVVITTWGSIAGEDFSLWISGVADVRGNKIKTPEQRIFTASSDPDITPPHVVSVFPANGSSNASVATEVVVRFSEGISLYGNSITWTSASGPVAFHASYFDDLGSIALFPDEVLNNNEQQTVVLSAVHDPAGNVMPDMDWLFKTTRNVDHTAPTVVSTIPQNLAVNVSPSAPISITFSEVISPYHFNVVVNPGYYYDGVWSNDGRTFTLNGEEALQADTQYILTVYPAGVVDPAGNHFEKIQRIVFSTGNKIATGRISGTITGDPGTSVDDPTGATVALFNADDAVMVEANDTYSIPYLKDGTYDVIAVKDSDGDGRWSPFSGDPVGQYGVNLANHDYDPDSVVINGGNHATNISFPIYDPSAIVGTVTYESSLAPAQYEFFIGLFKKAGFNPSNPTNPVASTGEWIYFYEGDTSSFGDWFLNSLQDNIPDDDYYLFAYLNLNEWTTYEPGVDAAGMYGGMQSPTVLHLKGGADFLNIVFPLLDPSPASTTGLSVAWPGAMKEPSFNRLWETWNAPERKSGQPLAARFGSKIISARD